MRLFVGIALEAAARAAAAEAGAALRARLAASGAPDARWIDETNLHITLWFLGEVGEAVVPAVHQALAPPVALAPFTLVLEGFGAFPAAGAPRVFWLGVGAGRGEMAALHGIVAERLAPFGDEPEARAYSPHLTLARVRDPRGQRPPARRVREALAAAARPPIESRVDSLTLFRSHLSPKGARYEAVLRVPLAG